jgi:hypothetical protein
MQRLFVIHIANSFKRHIALANCIWCGDRHSGSNKAGFATKINTAFALDTATLCYMAQVCNSQKPGQHTCANATFLYNSEWRNLRQYRVMIGTAHFQMAIY